MFSLLRYHFERKEREREGVKLKHVEIFLIRPTINPLCNTHDKNVHRTFLNNARPVHHDAEKKKTILQSEKAKC